MGAIIGSPVGIVKAADAVQKQVVTEDDGYTSLTLNVPVGAVPGGIIEINGKLNNNAAAGVSIGVTVKDPTGSLVYVDETRTGDDASFEFGFTLPDNASCGEWQVQVAGGGATASKTFSVGGAAGVVTVSPSGVKPGGAVTISGKAPQGYVAVGITVKNPGGAVAFVDQTTPGSDGGYSFQFILPADAPTGVWTVDVAGGGSAGRATFELVSLPQQPGIELEAPSSAVLGETLEIKGQYSGEEVSGVSMTITVKNANGAVFYVDETRTGTDGKFSFRLTIPADAPTGTWTVDVAGGGASAGKSFSVGELDNKVSVTVSPSSVKSGGAFIEHFDLKPADNSATATGAYYSFDYSNAHFVVLNTNEDSPEYADFTPAQIQWMEDDVQAAKDVGAKWIIVIIHKGPYTTSNHATERYYGPERRQDSGCPDHVRAGY